ncbi:MAG TPA: hypothetical protein VJ378_02375 [Candidatus Paceibacterota bacterium]|nr:hypothetical protein [Candidatus Paceibacterota bacterium]
MAERVKKSIPWFLTLALIGLVIGLGFNVGTTTIKADDVSTSVTVGNAAPSFTAGPVEDAASYGTTPTNVGSNITLKATASDPNTDNYYLAICKTNAVSAGTGGGAPTCTGGNWCISSSVADDAEATCNYTALIGDSESNVWYAFLCDAASSNQQCSASSQGSGDPGSPFKVNHRPSFTVVNECANVNPGSNCSITTTASDSDTDTSADTISLYVCKAADFTGTVCGGGGTWCSSTGQASNPSCNAAAPTPSEGAQSYYAYMIDSHSFAASGSPQGEAQSFTVNNVAPVVSSMTLNGGSDITLTENTTTNVVVTATVSDNNGCGEVDADGDAFASIYRSGIGWAGCSSDDANNCYRLEACVYGASSCTGGTDLDSTFTCTVAIQYHADPTDVGTLYPTETWLTTVQATDEALSGNTEVAAGVEMISLSALDITSSVAYGSLAPGQENSSDQTTTVTATGNVGLDAEYSGTAMASGGDTIPVGQQKYDLTGSKVWSSMDYALSVSATERELNCAKTTNSASPATANTYWRIQIPSAQPAGSYSGTDTVGAVTGETGNW